MRQAHRLLITGIFLSIACKAQDLSKNIIDISAGIGIPVGVFASKTYNIKSGLANPGPGINLEYSHYFKPRLGFCFGIRRSVFPVDEDALTNSNPNLFASSDPWRLLSVYAGLTSRKKRLRDKVILSYKAAIGLTTSRYPEETFINYNYPNPVTTTFRSNSGNAVAFLVGVTLKYILSQKIQLGLNIDYLSTSPKFIVTETVSSSNQPTKIYNLHYTQNMQAITVGVAVCYNFGK